MLVAISIDLIAFQPTLPARGATLAIDVSDAGCQHFNPRSPHGERPDFSARLTAKHTIFQPTLPARGATLSHTNGNPVYGISTHAPRTGSDEIILGNERNNTIFQPTLPARGATMPRR